MSVSKLPFILIFLSLLCQIFIIFASHIPATTNPLPDSIAISCGSSGSLAALDGRFWMGDSGVESTLSLQINGKSSNSRAIHQLASFDPVPCRTARASHNTFSYIFRVKPGQKFIRLHFYQDSYKGFKRSEALFTVKAGPYTLLSNFSTVLAADVLGEKHIIKEYCVNIDDGWALTITFLPAQGKKKSDNFYAFVNGIEVVSMPTGHYFTPEGELGALVVGKKYRFFVDNSTALELVQRLNIGGTSILPAQDSHLFRRWDEDSNYLLERGQGALPVNTLTTVRYADMLTYVAPVKVYQTSRMMLADTKLSASTLKWKLSVHLGFRYLIRLHFSKFDQQTMESPNKNFSVLINNQIAEDNVNIIQWGGVSGVAVYRDYIVMMEGDKMEEKSYLTILYQPKFESTAEQFHSTLIALEVFKQSNPDNNLAGKWPVPELQHSNSTPKQKKSKSSYRINLISAILTAILALMNVAVYNLKRISDSSSRRVMGSSLVEDRCRKFSIEEIRLATNSFDPQFQIGSGGYGRVYKGNINNGATVVAIKRLKTESRQGETEFQTEIMMLSKLRHVNLVSLIGYCNDGQERILVYQYISQGTLADQLYKANGIGRSNLPLSWELRLKVSIGAACGLYHLHSQHGIIHRDVKSTNILLDENWVAKISDFGLSKMGPPNDSFTHISTNVKGTFGYLDPEYFLTRKLTRKSDVYAFGVVLFEVLSGRPPVNIRLDEEQHSLAGWARYCIRDGRVDRLIDPNLMEQISPACLKVFVGIAGRCLHIQPQGRPSIADVVVGLELALLLQHTKDPIEQEEEDENSGRSYSDHSDGVVCMDDISFPTGESYRISSEDDPSSSTTNGGSDQKSRKKKARDNGLNNDYTRWWWDPFGILPRTTSKSKQRSEVIHQFSLQEIQRATNNFHKNLMIGYGGLDSVYKGCLDGGKRNVAIRRSRATESRVSMAHELQTKKDTQMTSSPAQDYALSLIGYCETESDMILVYEHMENGTLYDHLHDALKDPLPWKRRLQICIGAARSLEYLHFTLKQTMLHLNLTSTNIWLNENWTPKISGWGLSKITGNNQVPSVIKSNWGILDSNYIHGEHLTAMSCVYSFGVILFEVLFAEKESDRWLNEDHVTLAQWIKTCTRTNLPGCIDPFLVGRTAPDSLKIFVETAGRCLKDSGIDRPSMTDVVARLEDALQLQEATEATQGIQPRRS
ncbi:receptor-like protein kinase FERONIA [Salvia hispanica]|uniref:receptor-like protein kinase FERONIA n=1 Tax=Salvia hispanica TaxID=49212 RepID=UPI002009B29C|nr:receptor-like protein kinase FERONIA [Salvia hispanica]